MRTIDSPDDMRAEASAQRARNSTLGLVMTSGALHAGHAALIRRARGENDAVVVSVFVNPARFESDAEFDAYPRTPEEDAALAEREGADILFTPSPDAMFSPRAQTIVHVYGLTRSLCGLSRGQGYFRAATTTAAKLFNIIQPARVYCSQKNAQRAMAIQRMAIDLNFPVDITVCPTVREKDGLAAHALNAAIPPAFRPAALTLREALVLGRGLLREGQTDAFALSNSMQEHILKNPHVELDYLDLVSPETLEPVETVDDLTLMAAAATVAGVRLTDNILVGPDGPWED